MHLKDFFIHFSKLFFWLYMVFISTSLSSSISLNFTYVSYPNVSKLLDWLYIVFISTSFSNIYFYFNYVLLQMFQQLDSYSIFLLYIIIISFISISHCIAFYFPHVYHNFESFYSYSVGFILFIFRLSFVLFLFNAPMLHFQMLKSYLAFFI